LPSYGSGFAIIHDTRAPGVGISDGESGGYEENADFVGGFCVYFEVGM
jgi:hypothetical protein